jgi:hypothetical protein
MNKIIIGIIVFCVLSSMLFLIIELIMPKLNNNNQFKKWWRRNVIDLNPND